MAESGTIQGSSGDRCPEPRAWPVEQRFYLNWDLWAAEVLSIASAASEYMGSSPELWETARQILPTKCLAGNLQRNSLEPGKMKARWRGLVLVWTESVILLGPTSELNTQGSGNLLLSTQWFQHVETGTFPEPVSRHKGDVWKQNPVRLQEGPLWNRCLKEIMIDLARERIDWKNAKRTDPG